MARALAWRAALAGAWLIGSPGAALAACREIETPHGPGWYVDVGSSNGWESRGASACSACGGQWTPVAAGGYYCRRTSGTRGAQAAVGDELLQGAFNAGVALGEWIDAEAARGRATKAAEAERRRQEEEARRMQEAREREESWQRLNGSLAQDGGSPEIALRMDEGPAPLGLKLEDEAGPQGGGGTGEAVMPRHRPSSPKVKIRRYTAAPGPQASPKAAGAAPARTAGCGRFDPPELREGQVSYRVRADGCPGPQLCAVTVDGQVFQHEVGRDEALVINVGAPPERVAIHDFEKVRRVEKACQPAS